jgi:NhaA family Na+:H+ antiporter
LAGIGFTVALFMSGLSFEDEALIAASKIAVIAASLAAGIIGFVCLRLVLKDKPAGIAA